MSHDVEPSSLHSGDLQYLQESAPLELMYCPFEQLLHLDDPVELYLPGEQDLQDTAPEELKEPASQLTHCVLSPLT